MASERTGRSVTRTVVWYWLPIVVYVALIFSLSSMSFLPVRFPFRHFDKVLHFAEYTLLAVLVARALGSLNHLRSWWIIILLTFFFCAILGAIDEVFQATVPNRVSDVVDVLADSLGGLLGGTLYRVLRVLLKRNNTTPGVRNPAD
jgi:glycopeptide antibiotics resistance protein